MAWLKKDKRVGTKDLSLYDETDTLEKQTSFESKDND